MNWQKTYHSKLVTQDEAAKKIVSDDRVFFSSGASTPIELISALCRRREELNNVTLMGGLVFVPLECFKKEFKGHINCHSFFLGPAERAFIPHQNIESTSFQFSHTVWLQRNISKANVLLAEVSAPDENGNMSYGPHGSFSNHTCRAVAKLIIVQVNKKTPFVCGNEETYINVKDVDFICETDRELVELKQAPPNEIEKEIASQIIPYVEDGSTIQIGIGGLGNAVGYFLEQHKDLGIHTEMAVDSMVALAKKGVITGKHKTINPGEISICFGVGTKSLYEFMNKNEILKSHHIGYIADPYVIGQHKNFVSINNAMSCDLTGQVCSESIGHYQYSGTGGQVDFVRGATLSEGGKSFIAIESTYTKKDGSVHSRIVSSLAPGSIVTTPRTDVHYIVTEYGVANLRCQSIPKRVQEMIKIAHPMFREQLEKEAREYNMLYD